MEGHLGEQRQSHQVTSDDRPAMPRRSEPLLREADANNVCGLRGRRAVSEDRASVASLSRRPSKDTVPARSQSHALPRPAVRSPASC